MVHQHPVHTYESEAWPDFIGIYDKKPVPLFVTVALSEHREKIFSLLVLAIYRKNGTILEFQCSKQKLGSM